MESHYLGKDKLFWFAIFVLVAVFVTTWDPSAIIQNQTLIKLNPSPPQQKGPNEPGPEPPQEIKLKINVTSFDWGIVYPGKTYSRALQIINIGNINTQLSLTIQNFNPKEAGLYLHISWDQENTVLDANKSLDVTFNLMVLPEVKNVESFSFEIVINAVSN